MEAEITSIYAKAIIAIMYKNNQLLLQQNLALYILTAFPHLYDCGSGLDSVYELYNRPLPQFLVRLKSLQFRSFFPQRFKKFVTKGESI